MANPARLVSGLRAKGYGAVLLAFFEGVPLIEVYNFLGLNNLPEVLWRGLDPDRIAVECGASGDSEWVPVLAHRPHWQDRPG